MSRRKSNASDWGFGLMLGVGLGLGLLAVASSVESAVPTPTGPRSPIAYEADHAFFNRLVSIWRDPRIPATLRQQAGTIARFFHQYWLEAGHAGRDIVRGSGGRFTLYNWCGAGYGGGPCLNAIDCACRDHDLARLQAFG